MQHLKKFFPIIILSLILFGSLALVNLISTNGISLTPLNYSSVSLEGHKRLLVLAPHCDDETLGAGDLIQAAIRDGIEVHVVILTNGDGYLFATMEDFHRIYPRSADFIRMGYMRQQESLKALQLLGVPAENVTFLSYPDRGTPAMWNDHWLHSNPYRSPYSGYNHSPYTITYDPEANFSGEDLSKDLRSILSTYQPDLIVYPDPFDVHPDHWGLSAFTRLALSQVEAEITDYKPDALTYLVHRPDFPEPRGLHPDASLQPPPALIDLNLDWQRLDASPEQSNTKLAAVNAYRSQLSLLRELLFSFVRKNELFGKVTPVNLPDLGSGNPVDPSTWQAPDGKAITPVQQDPVKDVISRDVFGSADLVGLFAARTADNQLAICAQVRGKAQSNLIYTLRVNAFGTDSEVHHVARNNRPLPGWHRTLLSGNYACDEIRIAELGNPNMLFVGANVEQLGVGILDQTAWQQVNLTPLAPAGNVSLSTP